MLRISSAGESHGRAMVTLVEGIPAGVPVTVEMIDTDLARRQLGHGRGGRMQIETDVAQILAGVRLGRALGSPIALAVANKDWENWLDVMKAEPAESAPDAVTAPRPGHADLAGAWKTGTSDIRDVLERASARETVSRVAAGAVCRSLLGEVGMTVASRVVSIGEIRMDAKFDSQALDSPSIDSSPVRCPDPEASPRMVEAIDGARAKGQTIGGVFEVVVDGVIPGLGGYSTVADRLDGALAGAVMSIPAVKGVEIGDGFRLAARLGGDAHDEMVVGDAGRVKRVTNRAGGLEGGMTNGEELIVRAAVKPIPTLATPLRSVDIATGESVDACKERSDICVVPAAAVVGEAMVAIELAKSLIEKFGGDCLSDTERSVGAYLERIGR